MDRRRSAAALAAVALLGAGCADAVSSMTEHWFYGYVRSTGEELCLSDARTEDREAERCFSAGDADTGALAEGDLVKVRYERDEGDGHGGGRLLEVVVVQKAGNGQG